MAFLERRLSEAQKLDLIAQVRLRRGLVLDGLGVADGVNTITPVEKRAMWSELWKWVGERNYPFANNPTGPGYISSTWLPNMRRKLKAKLKKIARAQLEGRSTSGGELQFDAVELATQELYGVEHPFWSIPHDQLYEDVPDHSLDGEPHDNPFTIGDFASAGDTKPAICATSSANMSWPSLPSAPAVSKPTNRTHQQHHQQTSSKRAYNDAYAVDERPPRKLAPVGNGVEDRPPTSASEKACDAYVLKSLPMGSYVRLKRQFDEAMRQEEWRMANLVDSQ